VPSRRDISSGQRCAAAALVERHDIVVARRVFQEDAMALLLAFLTFVVVGQVANVMACLALERIYPGAVTLAIFFVLWIGVFWGSWRLALRLTEPRSRAAAGPEQQLIIAVTAALQLPMVA
jgi:hypothetical protein